MTIEQIELRKILTQMLADNGINRETIVPFVQEIVNEKVEKAVERVMHDKDIESMVHTASTSIIRQTITQEVERRVRKILNCTTICITHKKDETE